MKPILKIPYCFRMFAMHDQRFRDIVLLFAGFLGILWFFIHMGSHWVGSTSNLTPGIDGYRAKADSVFRQLSYQPITTYKTTNFTNFGLHLDTLQRRVGAKKLIETLDDGDSTQLPVYRANIEWYRRDMGRSTLAEMELSQQGELVGFYVAPEIINQQTPFNARVVSAAIKEWLGKDIPKSTLDTLITGMVEIQHFRDNSSSAQNMISALNRLTNNRGKEFFDDYLSDESIWWGAEQYISQSYWKRFSFKRDSLIRDDISGYRVAKAYFTSQDTVLGIAPTLEVDILPAGSLHAMKATYFTPQENDDSFLSAMERLHQFGILAFMVWLLTIFYLRIKARAIDTRPAFIVSFITGFMVSVLYILAQFGGVDYQTVLNEQGVVNILFVIGILGAVSAISFFLLTSVSDSVTRQYWPEKLRTWDLVRRGMFNNKPVGWAIMRGIAVGGVVTGIYMLLLDLVPGMYLETGLQFNSQQFMLGSVARLIINLLMSLGIIVPVFMIVANQFRSRSQKRRFIPLIGGLCFLIIPPIYLDIYPFEHSMLISLVIGSVLGLFYIYFDFVTLSLAFFTFLNLILTKQGWLVEGSPDINVFIVFAIITLVLLCVSFLFIVNGNERDSLPDYIPEYLEDQAREQRVNQELEIARNVQTTFLPNTTPDVPGFDTAAICEPAQDTGGDYYDIICIDDDKAAIAIGDVSGKGIQAAFYMTFAKGVIHSLCSIFPSPKTMLYRVNKLFNQNATRGTFISMIYGVLNPADRTFTFIRAGHNPILYKKASGEMKWLQPKGVAIGMTKGEIFNKMVEEETVSVDKGDVLVLYTDGITEAQNDHEEFYDEKRLFKLLKREKTGSAEELRDLIIEDVRTFMGNARQYDDMTLVVIKG